MKQDYQPNPNIHYYRKQLTVNTKTRLTELHYNTYVRQTFSIGLCELAVFNCSQIPSLCAACLVTAFLSTLNLKFLSPGQQMEFKPPHHRRVQRTGIDTFNCASSQLHKAPVVAALHCVVQYTALTLHRIIVPVYPGSRAPRIMALDHKDEGSKMLHNIRNYLSSDTVQHPTI